MRLSRTPFLIRSFLAAALVVGVFLGACSSNSGNYRTDTAHKDLLDGLRQCLVELPISGSRGKDFVSPCVGRDVSSLNGISRGHLQDILGPPRLCLTETETNFPEKDHCPSGQDPVWSFYRHADSIDIGGGPELVCVSHASTRCATVEWRRTK